MFTKLNQITSAGKATVENDRQAQPKGEEMMEYGHSNIGFSESYKEPKDPWSILIRGNGVWNSIMIGRCEGRPNWFRRFWYWALLDWKWIRSEKY